MLFIRLKKACCVSLRQYALRQTIRNMISFLVAGLGGLITLGVMCNQGEEIDQFTLIVLISGSLQIIPFCFSCLLLWGVLKESKKILYVWMIYGSIEMLLQTVFDLSFSIYGFTQQWLIGASIFLVLGILYPMGMYYLLCIVNSLRLSYAEKCLGIEIVENPVR